MAQFTRDQALADLSAAFDAIATSDSPMIAAQRDFYSRHERDVTLLQAALTTRAVAFANRTCGGNDEWRVAMQVLTGELLALAAMMAGSLSQAGGRAFSPGEIAVNAYAVAQLQQDLWPQRADDPRLVADQWMAALEAGRRTTPVEGHIMGWRDRPAPSEVIEQTLAEAGLEWGDRIPHLTPGETISFDGPGLRRLEVERQYWREHAACEIDALLRAIDQRAAPKAFLIERLNNAYQGLKDALDGDYLATCEGCGGRIWPGDIEIPCTDVRCHADCSGQNRIKAGDQVKVDPESLELEQGQEPRDYVIACAATNLFTAEEIQARVDRASLVLAGAEPRVTPRRRAKAEAV